MNTSYYLCICVQVCIYVRSQIWWQIGCMRASFHVAWVSRVGAWCAINQTLQPVFYLIECLNQLGVNLCACLRKCLQYVVIAGSFAFAIIFLYIGYGYNTSSTVARCTCPEHRNWRRLNLLSTCKLHYLLKIWQYEPLGSLGKSSTITILKRTKQTAKMTFRYKLFSRAAPGCAPPPHFWWESQHIYICIPLYYLGQHMPLKFLLSGHSPFLCICSAWYFRKYPRGTVCKLWLNTVATLQNEGGSVAQCIIITKLSGFDSSIRL